MSFIKNLLAKLLTQRVIEHNIRAALYAFCVWVQTAIAIDPTTVGPFVDSGTAFGVSLAAGILAWFWGVRDKLNTSPKSEATRD